jgi:hypothetical protein
MVQGRRATGGMFRKPTETHARLGRWPALTGISLWIPRRSDGVLTRTIRPEPSCRGCIGGLSCAWCGCCAKIAG